MRELSISILAVILANIHCSESLPEKLNISATFLNITGPKGADVTRDLLHTSLLKKLHSLATTSGSTLNTKGFLGMDSVMEVLGPLALAAMVTLPFMAPAAAALLPLAGLTSVFGKRRRRRRRRHLGDPMENSPESNRQRFYKRHLNFHPLTWRNQGDRHIPERIKAERNLETLLKVFHSALRDDKNIPK